MHIDYVEIAEQPLGTFNCPICGVDIPHHHPRWDVERHQTDQESEPQRVTDADGCPTELAVLQRFWRERHANMGNGGPPSNPHEKTDVNAFFDPDGDGDPRKD
jgi:hypothetical protein